MFRLRLMLVEFMSVISSIYGLIRLQHPIAIDLTDFTQIKYIGRYDHISSPGHPRSDWPGSTFKVKVNITSTETDIFSIALAFNNYEDGIYLYQVEIDDIDYGYHEISSKTSKLSLSFSLSPGPHDVVFTKRTEASYSTATGVVEIQEIICSGVDILPQSTNEDSTKLLFIGDSVTAAYGVDGTYPCSFTPETENVLDSYTSIVSSSLDAESHIIAWSGKGVVRNYGDSNQISEDPMPVYYNRTIATDSDSYWDTSSNSFEPDLVYIMLGTNDYSTDPVPTDEQFTNGLVSFVEQVRSDYPSAVIVVACSPHHRLTQCSNIENAATITNVNYLYIDDSAYDGGYGCDSHPSVQTQINISETVLPFIQKLLERKGSDD